MVTRVLVNVPLGPRPVKWCTSRHPVGLTSRRAFRAWARAARRPSPRGCWSFMGAWRASRVRRGSPRGACGAFQRRATLRRGQKGCWISTRSRWKVIKVIRVIAIEQSRCSPSLEMALQTARVFGIARDQTFPSSDCGGEPW